MNKNKIYKTIINNREYTEWSIIDNETNTIIDDSNILSTINPIKNKLFSQDTVIINENKECIIHHSEIRNKIIIPGVLILEKNKTYGKLGKRNLYKCLPNDKSLPSFLIPYEIKMGFSKDFKNKYVTFQFVSWGDVKHPFGQLTTVIGNVEGVFHYFEYQLYCKNLNLSLSNFNRQLKQKMNELKDEQIISIIEEKYDIEDHLNKQIFSIDSKTTTDYDDAISIEQNGDRTHVYVYISSVILYLEVLKLWDLITNRVSTVYLPDRKRSMLPVCLSDSLCSLKQHNIRIATTFEFIYSNKYELIDVKYYNSKINVNKNYVYNEDSLLNNLNYQQLFELTKTKTDFLENSNDLVAYWMINVNKTVSEKLLENRCGIYRSVSIINKDKHIDSELSIEASRAIRTWNNVIGTYVYFSDHANLKHDMLDIKSYVHITSPIRRLVDILNQIELMDVLKIQISDECKIFHKSCIDKLQTINTDMRSVRKIQYECDLLHKCHFTPDILDKTYDGILFNKEVKDDGSYNYMVYLEELKLLYKYNHINNHENCERQKFSLFIFEKESNFKKKIKLQIKEK
jgi:hypothetical protein